MFSPFEKIYYLCGVFDFLITGIERRGIVREFVHRGKSRYKF